MESRVLGTVDIGGQGVVKDFGMRIQISPAVVPEAAGGPLIDSMGSVVGILGGSLNPDLASPETLLASARVYGLYLRLRMVRRQSVNFLPLFPQRGSR
jgi:hypothetical protein